MYDQTMSIYRTLNDRYGSDPAAVIAFAMLVQAHGMSVRWDARKTRDRKLVEAMDDVMGEFKFRRNLKAVN